MVTKILNVTMKLEAKSEAEALEYPEGMEKLLIGDGV